MRNKNIQVFISLFLNLQEYRIILHICNNNVILCKEIMACKHFNILLKGHILRFMNKLVLYLWTEKEYNSAYNIDFVALSPSRQVYSTFVKY